MKFKVETTEQQLIIHSSGKVFSFDWKKISARLAKASIPERNNFILSPSGYGIHWPEVDEDLSIKGLLENRTYNGQQKHSVVANEPKPKYKTKKK